MNREQFFERVSAVLGESHLPSIENAYWLAKATHRGQTRDEGERYFEHCRRVALVLVDSQRTRRDQIIVSLLHDCIEDGFLPEHILKLLFGREVAQAVAVLSKVIPVFDKKTGAIETKQKKSIADYFRRIAESPKWVRRVKCADRLDNIRTMGVWPRVRIEKYLSETDEYILPMARETDAELFVQIQKACEAHRARH